jgi:hypothetical protein
MKQLTKERASEFVRIMYEITNPIKPHEAKTIKSILQTKNHQNGWRFKNHNFCRGCGRELTVLDMFLSGLEHHSAKYIHDYLYEGAPGGGEIIYEDGENPTIQVFKHGLRVTCVSCGVISGDADSSKCDLYFYKRPRRPVCVISMSVYWYNKIMTELAKKPAHPRPHHSHKT